MVEKIIMSMSFDLSAYINSSAQELEKLSWYDMISRMGLSSFNWSGEKPIRMIIDSAQIQNTSKVLMVGCGAGGSAILIAEITGADVFGIDVAEGSIRQAQINAQKTSAASHLHFQVGNAHQLPYDDLFFDVIITEFMAFFLEPSAFEQCYRVCKVGGRIGLAEIMLDDNVSPHGEALIHETEAIYSELTGHPFHIPKISRYQELLKKAKFEDIQVTCKFPRPSFHDLLQIVGGWGAIWKILKKTMQIMKESSVIKKRFLINKKVKNTLIRNPKTAKFIFQGILLAKKKH